MDPVISIVIPLYNKEKTVEATLNSVLLQRTRVPFEIVVVDDGSTDDSASVVNAAAGKDNRIRYCRQANGGPGTARNAGVDLSRGDWILFLDADDILLPNGIEALYGAAVKYPSINFACANYRINSNVIPMMRIKNGLVENPFRSYVFMRIYPQQGTYIFRKKVLSDFRFDTRLRRYEDHEMLFRYFRKGEPVVSTSAIVMEYNFGTLCASRTFDLERDFIGHLDFNGKSFWEKVALGHMINVGKKNYDDLTKKYSKYMLWAMLARIFSLYARVLNKATHLFAYQQL